MLGVLGVVTVDRANERIVECTSNLRTIRATIDLSEGLDRDDALRHRTMSAADTEPLDDRSDDLARRTHITDVAHREDEISADRADSHGPFGALRLQRHVGDLRNHVFANSAENEDMDTVTYLGFRKRTTKGLQTPDR